MTLSKSRRDEPWSALESLSRSREGTRSDVVTLLKFQDDPDSLNPLYLFWSLHQPGVTNSEGNTSRAPRLSGRDEEAVLEALDLLYKRYQVVHEPDTDYSAMKKFLVDYDPQNDPEGMSFPEVLKNVLIFIHVAAARAFMINRTGGFSDETRSCLSDVERIFALLRRSGFDPKRRIDPILDGGNLEGAAIFLSTLAVTANSFVALSRMNRVDGRYADALHYLAQAGELYEHALPTPMGTWEAWPLGVGWRMPQHLGNTTFDKFLKGLRIPIEEITKTFELLKTSASSIGSWTDIVDDCRTLANQSWCWRFHEYEAKLLEE